MNEMKLRKIVNKDKTYLGKNGREYTAVNYYLVVYVNNREKLIPIRPCFSRGYNLLDLFAEVVYNAKIEVADDENED